MRMLDSDDTRIVSRMPANFGIPTQVMMMRQMSAVIRHVRARIVTERPSVNISPSSLWQSEAYICGKCLSTREP